MSENYSQHADHFSRILSEQENLKQLRYTEKTSKEKNKDLVNFKDNKTSSAEEKKDEKIQSEAN